MAEEFQGGVCGRTWWDLPRNLFSGGGGSALSSPCSVAQLGGGIHDLGNFGWSNEVTKNKPSNVHAFEKNNNISSICDNSLIFPADMGSTLDILGFGLSTVDWNQPYPICNGGNGGNFESILQEDLNSGLSYEMKTNSPTLMNSNSFSSNNSCNQEASPPMTMPASSNSSGDSSTITSEGGLNTSFPMSSTASYLIQTLFDDSDDSNLINPNFGAMSSGELLSPPCNNSSWVKPSTANSFSVQPHPTPSVPVAQTNKFNEQMSLMMNNNGGQALNGQYSNGTTLCNVQASMLNSLQSRSRAPALNKNSSHYCAKLGTKEEARDSKSNISEQPQAKRPRIEAPSPLPTFKVRKEKLGDRITALQQLVSPFGKTDTASVLHEAIEYIKFLHDQVNVLSNPYLKNGATVQHQQGSETQDKEEAKHDLRSRGLCLVPISSTYPVAQETPVDFWTPTFGGTAFR